MKTGLFGGAFNPLHNGHLKVARCAIKTAGLDRLIFIPTGSAPHKAESGISRSDRFEMVKLAIENEEKMYVSDYELNRSEISYSADTVEHFKELYPDDELFFIMGDDSYNKLGSWHEPERIINLSTLLVFPREGTEKGPDAIFIEMDKVEVSSKEIREKIKTGKDFKNLLPKSVFDYIIKGDLYTR